MQTYVPISRLAKSEIQEETSGGGSLAGEKNTEPTRDPTVMYSMIRLVSTVSSSTRHWVKETTYLRQSTALCPAEIIEHISRDVSLIDWDAGDSRASTSGRDDSCVVYSSSVLGTGLAGVGRRRGVAIRGFGLGREGARLWGSARASPAHPSHRDSAGSANTPAGLRSISTSVTASGQREGPDASAADTRAVGGGIKPELVAQKILMCDDPNDVFGTTVLTPSSISELPTTHLSAAARAAALSHITDAAFLDVLLHRVVQSLEQGDLEGSNGPKSLSPADVCNIIESFSELDYCHSIELKTVVSRYMLRNLELFSGDMLGHTLRSFANLNFYDDELLERVLTYMSEHAGDFSAENVADVVYAFSKCGFCHPDLISLVDQAGSMLLKEALHDNGEAIAGIVDAYSRVGCAESETLDALVELVTQSPDKIPANALASTLASAIRLGSEDQGMMNRVLGSLLPRMDDLETGVLVEVVVCLGGLGVRPKDERFLETLVEEVLPYRIGEMEEKQVSNVVDGLNKLGFYMREVGSLMGKEMDDISV